MNRLTNLRKLTVFLRSLHPQLRVSQLDLLLAVAKKEGQSQTDLAINCGLTLAAVSRAIDALGTSGRRDGKGARLGLLKAERDPSDDRFVLVFLTDKGRQILLTCANLVYPEQ
jgi:DNA-binding MarR family transcriptional regulator